MTTTTDAPESPAERITRERQDHNELSVVAHRIDKAHDSITDAAKAVKAAVAMTSDPSMLAFPEFDTVPTFGINEMYSALQVNKHGHFTKAAEALGMSQPGLSRQVQRVERGLGYKIFKRTGQGAIPTAKGRYALAFFQRVCVAATFVVQSPGQPS